MEINERIAHLSHEINALISKFAELEFRKIKNGYLIINEDLFELDQCIGERDGLER